jgi:hypothetical protein
MNEDVTVTIPFWHAEGLLDLGPCKTAQKRDREFLQNPHVCPFCDLLRAMDETVGTA